MITGIFLPVTITQIPPGITCFPTNQALLDYIQKSIRVELPFTYSFFVLSSTTPSVEQRNLLWVRIDDTTRIISGQFTWSPTVGAWVSPHWLDSIPPSFERRLFTGTLTDLETYDGGEPGTISDSTGPFWTRDANWDDKWPIGVGTTVATVSTDVQIFDDAVPGDPKGRGVYFIKPTGRLYDRSE